MIIMLDNVDTCWQLGIPKHDIGINLVTNPAASTAHAAAAVAA